MHLSGFYLIFALLFYKIFSVPVTGNFTEEEGAILSQDNNSVEYPLQRDEMHTISNKGDRNHTPQGINLIFLHQKKNKKS